MKSSLLREHKFRLLFQFDLLNQDLEKENELRKSVDLYFEYLLDGKEDEDEIEFEEEDVDDSSKELIINFFRLYRDKKIEIDECIKNGLKGWRIERIAKEDLNILRLAVYEAYYDDRIDIAVAMDEAVELAKAYGNSKVSKFINGILRTIYENKKNEEEG